MAQPTLQVAQLTETRTRKGSVSDSLWAVAARRVRRDRLSMVALTVLLIMTALSVGAPLIAGVMHIDPETVTDQTFLPPGTAGHLLGTDDLGRDHFIRLLYAGQVSLGIAFFAGTLSIFVGITIGVAAGYFGGLLDDLVLWFITTIDSIPFLYLLLLITSIFRPSPPVLVLILGLFGWTTTMRLVRGETLSLREREFIVAAKAIGATSNRVMFVHIVPNVISIIIVTIALNLGGLILLESALSFLGFGVQPPATSWGFMLSDAQELFTKGPHLVWGPGLLIVITVLCLFVLGDGLRDAFDPQLVEK